MCLGYAVQQTLLKVSGQYGLIEHFLLLGYIVMFIAIE